MKDVKKFEDFFLNESKDSKTHIDIDKLIKISEAIQVLCNGEYGDVYFKEDENKVFVCLGDSNPFDSEFLEEFIKEAIAKNYDNDIHIEIDNECYPDDSDSWKRYDKGKFK
jgi:hypothetical protein